MGRATDEHRWSQIGGRGAKGEVAGVRVQAALETWEWWRVSFVSAKHLQTYLNEYAFRYNRRGQAEPMFQAFLGQVVAGRGE